MASCLFCKIVEGTIPATKVYENETILAFKDIQPQAPKHYLFIPKKHVESFSDLPLEEMDLMTDLFSAIKTVCEKEGLSSKGFRTVMNTRKEGGQSVFHLHLHVIGGRQLGGNMAGI